MEDKTDQRLVADYMAGKEQSLELLIKRYLKSIYFFAYYYAGNTQDAEDVAQEVFLRAWRRIKKFDQKKSFKTWIFSIAKNASINTYKRKKTIPFSAFSASGGENIIIETLVDSLPLPDELLEMREQEKILTKAIEKFSLNYRAVILLRYNNDLTFREIAESLNESLNTVKSRYNRALAILKKLLSE